jgi:hypothetical protein
MESMTIVRKARNLNRVGLYAGVTLLLAVPPILHRMAQDRCNALQRSSVIIVNHKMLKSYLGESLPLLVAGPMQVAIVVSAVLLISLAIINQRLWKQISNPPDRKSEKHPLDPDDVPNADGESGS